MPNYISGITLGSSTYSIQDTEARTSLSSAFSAIETLSSSVTTNTSNITALSSAVSALTGATKWIGVTTTNISDGSTTNPITINGEEVEAEEGNITSKGSKEFIWNGTTWQEFGDLSSLGSLAFKDSASAIYTPGGTVSVSLSADITIPVTVSTSDTITVLDSTPNVYGFYPSNSSYSFMCNPSVSDGILMWNTQTPSNSISTADANIPATMNVTLEKSTFNTNAFNNAFAGATTTITVS